MQSLGQCYSGISISVDYPSTSGDLAVLESIQLMDEISRKQPENPGEDRHYGNDDDVRH
jgi:hypothetical protein